MKNQFEVPAAHRLGCSADEGHPAPMVATWLCGHWFEAELRLHVTTFADLPDVAKLAIIRRHEECYTLPESLSTDAAVFEALKDIAAAYAEIPSKTVAQTIVGSPSWIHEGSLATGSNWDEYHAWYIHTGDVPDYPATNRWPAISLGYGPTVFEDGWHRTHSYFRSRHETIPVVAYDRNAFYWALQAVAQNRSAHFTSF